MEFSALLRQPRSVSDKEKLAYVDTIIDLLDLHDIEVIVFSNLDIGSRT